MAPSQKKNGAHEPSSDTSTRPQLDSGEEVVISGISGVFPKSDNTTQFSENLYNNVDLVSETNTHLHHPEAPRHLGQINGMDKFDAQFFRVTFYQATTMDPVSRKLLEHAYTAVYDAGINPLELRGKKVGVFIGTSFSDTSNISMFHEGGKTKGNILSGCGKSMFANRISYFLDARGPSYSLDCSCASSMVCLEHAYLAISKGECEAAIVGGGNVCILPELGLNLRKGGMACLDGKTKCFDANGDGPVRAEAVNCIFLQKAKDAKRIYAEVYFAQVKYGLNEDAYFLPTRKTEDIVQFLRKIYSQIKVSPQEIEYVEADGSAIAEADENELKAIGDIFSRGNDKPVKVGSVKSYMGHAEPASGVCAITKVCLAYQTGKLPANLHYKEPLNVPEINNGKIQILQKNETFNRGLTAVNQFSFNGTNCHVLLKGRYKPKDTSKYKTNIPRLVLVSGRQDECVEKILKHIEHEPIDPEVIGMLHNIYRIETVGHTSRGYTIIESKEGNETNTLARGVKYYSGAKRPLCLIFSGLGSQWPGMAAELMKIPTFASTMHRCHKALEPVGIDLINVITDPDKTMFDKILNCFIGISAVQIGLCDVLKELGVIPDYIIGHSQGEMACAYWDDSYSAEDAILAAYSRGISSFEAKTVKGAMAAVGLGYKDIYPLCPPEVDVACRNSNESATISGPADVIEKFGLVLKEKGIFFREVASANLAFHSRYIRPAGPVLLQKLKAIIKEPKLRSEKWISTSVPEEKWHEDYAKYSSAEYHTNNLTSPVYFEEATQHIPSNAVVVEVAPHGLLQAILKRSHPECTHIPLTRRGHENQLKFFLEAIGKLYQEGYDLQMDVIYPKIEYPVSTETKMISHLVDWEHSENWPHVVNNTNDVVNTTYREFKMSIYDDEYKFIVGHIRDGKNVFPESAMLFLVWETLAMSKGVSHKDLSVEFHDIQFHKEAIILAEEIFRLSFMINKGDNYFEITQGKELLANGYIAAVSKLKLGVIKYYEHETKLHNGEIDEWAAETSLNSDDLYQHLHAKGLTYKYNFQSLKSSNFERTEALVKWNENWVTFLDSLIQLNILARDSEGIAVPKIIKKLAISTEEFKMQKTVVADKEQCFNAKFYPVYDITRCAGIEIKQIIWDDKQIQKKEPDVLESLVFSPHFTNKNVSIETALQINLQLVADNISDENITATEVIIGDNTSISDVIEEVAQYLTEVNVEVQTIPLSKVNKNLANSNLIILSNLYKNGTKIDEIVNRVNEDAFILTFDQSDFKSGYFDVLSSINVQENRLVLLRKKNYRRNNNVTYMSIKSDETFDWVPALKSELQKVNKITLISEKQPLCGLIGLVKSLRKEFPNKINLVVLHDYNAPSFDQNNPMYKEQLKKGLTFNILQKGQWGSYYFLQYEVPINAQNIKLTSAIHGNVNSLRWTEAPTLSSKNIVQICYAGLSEKDSQKASGLISNDEDNFGYDFSGFDTNGERVMGLISSGAIASTLQADPHLMWQVPKSWSLEDAATVPLPYAQAFYCLIIKGQLQKGQSIFINNGAGAFGQAVISIALSLGCSVHTSVESDYDKQFLLKLFSKLQKDNIGKSQNGEFCTAVKINTKGKGVDFVLSSASGFERQMVMKCVSPYGIFMDVNEYDWRTNQPLGLSYIQHDRNYMAVMISSIFKANNIKERKMIQCIVAEGIENGIVRPITRVVYNTTKAINAFKLFPIKSRRGRVLFKIRNAEIPTKNLNVLPRMAYSPTGTYIVVCDETTLGIELAHWLVKHGARKIMLHLKSKTVPGFMHLKFGSWMNLGAQIKISTENLNSDKICAEFLNEARKLGDIRGIFIIQESSVNNKRWSQKDFVQKYDSSLSKVVKLNVISRNNCPNLSEFVVISRSSRNIADKYMTSVSDTICEDRLKTSLPAVSFKIALLDELQADVQNEKIQSQNFTTVFNALERSMKQKQNSTITFNLKKQRDSEILFKVLRCLDIEDLYDINSRLTVNDLVSNESQLEQVKDAINDYCKVECDTEMLKVLPIISLKSFINKYRQHSNVNSKLGSFYTFVEKDEYAATDSMVPMETIISKTIKPNELDETATHLLLIPGFQGHHKIFKLMCETLKVRAVTFQLGPDDNILESLSDIANNILQLIKKSFVLKSKFYLFGYSFGVNIALEVANLLEKEGYVGLVYCLDSSPDALRVQLDAHIGNETDRQLQNSIIEYFFQLLSGEDSVDLAETIKQIDTWSDKVNACVDKLKNVASHSHQYIRNTLESAYRRILLVKSYNPTFRLESELVLLKGLPHPNSGNLDSDYGLSKYTKKPVNVINIPSDHASIPQNPRIPNIVNQFIDPELLENYNNLCHTYTI